MNHNKFSSLYSAAVVTFFLYIIELEPAVYSQIGKRWVQNNFSFFVGTIKVTVLVIWVLASFSGSLVEFLPLTKKHYNGVIVTSILFFVPLIFTLGANGIIVYIARTHARKRGVASFKKVRYQSQRRHFSKQSGRYPFLDIGVVPCYWLRSKPRQKNLAKRRSWTTFLMAAFAAIGRNKFSNKHYKERQ